MELVGYWHQDSRIPLHMVHMMYGLVYFGNLVDMAYKHFLLDQKKYHKYN